MIYPHNTNAQNIKHERRLYDKVANTLDEAVELMEEGFEYHTEIKGNKLFRKLK